MVDLPVLARCRFRGHEDKIVPTIPGTADNFSKEFKIEAMRLVQEHGVAVVQASRDLEVAESVLCRWIREANAAAASTFSGNGQ